MSTDSKGTDGDKPISLYSVFDSGYLIKGKKPGIAAYTDLING
jgi:hypothetical protein